MTLPFSLGGTLVTIHKKTRTQMHGPLVYQFMRKEATPLGA